MQIRRLEPLSEPYKVNSIADVYRKAYGGIPWNEGFVCPLCKKDFPLISDSKLCPECEKKSRKVLLVDYWPISKVVSDFYREMQKPEAICIVVEEGVYVVGFAWGYRVTANPELNEQLDAPGLSDLIKDDFFYLDECALEPAFQGVGIGRMLIRRILEEKLQKRVLLRTLNDSPMYSLAKRFGCETVQRISRGRVIMTSITT